MPQMVTHFTTGFVSLSMLRRILCLILRHIQYLILCGVWCLILRRCTFPFTKARASQFKDDRLLLFMFFLFSGNIVIFEKNIGRFICCIKYYPFTEQANFLPITAQLRISKMLTNVLKSTFFYIFSIFPFYFNVIKLRISVKQIIYPCFLIFSPFFCILFSGDLRINFQFYGKTDKYP